MLLDQNGIDEKIKKIEQIKARLERIVIDAARLEKDWILEQQRLNLMDGQDSDSNQIRPSYAKSTIKRKKKKGQPYDRVTLYDEGDFHAGIDVIFSDKDLTLVGKDSKTGFLSKRYGEAILGLDDQSVKELASRIKGVIDGMVYKEIL
jgi:regulator of replication initiation timing